MSLNISFFQKPSRYLGNEVNASRKESEVKVALCFPDTYEIGMSHLGLKILYSIINRIPYASAERVFSPWLDRESYLRQNSHHITSLEHARPLKDFDIVGFSLQYELSFTNILTMLNLGGIPTRSAERHERHPLIIAGGPCSVNPLPLSPYIDAFVIGDGEELVCEIVDVYLKYTSPAKKKKTRDSLLSSLAELQGIYVPSVHTHSKKKIRKRVIQDLNAAHFPDAPVIPFTPIIHDRIPIEIARGCTHGCRFCQAGMTYRPLRERSLENVLMLSEKSLENTGYEEISFTSLSTGDYPDLLPLLKKFSGSCVNYPVAVSLPSLRVGSLSKDVLKEIKNIRKTGFTIAPEAGTQRLRNVINKHFSEKEYEETLQILFKEGWHHVKLYFMIGLPSESPDDIEGIINMAEMALKKGREIAGGRININVGISAFVPKPHTPFQWLGQHSAETLRSKQASIRRALEKNGIKVKGQHIELSLLEAVFSRADQHAAELLEKAWHLGCRFDSWSDSFDFKKWLFAAEKTGIDLSAYAERTLDIKTELPWEFIDTGVTKEFLKSEYKKAFKGELTSDCRNVCCNCGLKCNNGTEKKYKRKQDVKNLNVTLKPASKRESSDARNRSSKSEQPVKMRIKFSKTGTLRYLSHREVMTVILRALHREKITLTYSQGFHPHPKLSFGPPLPVGVEGLNEFLDAELKSSAKQSHKILHMNACLPKGLRILSSTPVRNNRKSLTDFISRYEYDIKIEKSMIQSIQSLLNTQRYEVPRGASMVDIRPMIEKAEFNNGSLHLMLVDTHSIKVRLYEILQFLLQMPVDELQSIPIKRTNLYGHCMKKGWISPSEDAINE
jgi:radical SAM family uncharacterized protein/radical SAM-linked protein